MRKGGGSMEAGRMITRLMTSESSSKDAGHKRPLSADPSDFFPDGPGHQRKSSAWRQWTKRCSQPMACIHSKEIPSLLNENFSFFFFNDTQTAEIYTLSLHDALPI